MLIDFCLIFVPFGHYDEPEILRYAITSICPKGADVRHTGQFISAGKAIYDEHCASCHGDKLQGQPNFRQRLPNGKMPAPAHDRTGHTWHHPDWQLFEMTKTGRQPFRSSNYKTDMPAFKDKLSDAEIWMVLAFIKSTWPDNIQRRQAEITKNILR